MSKASFQYEVCDFHNAMISIKSAQEYSDTYNELLSMIQLQAKIGLALNNTSIVKSAVSRSGNHEDPQIESFFSTIRGLQALRCNILDKDYSD